MEEEKEKTANQEIKKQVDNIDEGVLKELTQQLKNMNKYLNENEKRVLETFRKKVSGWGNSAHIPMPRKYKDFDAIVKILKKEKVTTNENK